MNLISSIELAGLISGFNDIHETFSSRLAVYKEPIKTAVSIDPTNFLFGFGESQAADAYTYTEVSGVYPATVRYSDPQGVNIDLNTDINSYISNGGCVVKVKQDARDFIMNGKTEKFILDNRTWYLDSEDTKSVFIDDKYIFKLKATK